MFPPRRIICLSAETVETLYLLGEEDRVVGISGFATRPPRARREKPRVSAFQSADVGAILALAPDLVLTFSDVQAELAAELVRGGVAVHAFNQRDLAGILDMVRTVGALAGVPEKAALLVASLEARLADARARADGPAGRPRVYFEEWDDPMVSGIGWVSELVEVAGGTDIFADRARSGAAKDRVVTATEVVERGPEVIVGSWCGKRFRPEAVAGRPGFASTPAVRRGAVYEIESSLVLQPGPGAITDGLPALQALIRGA